jgi:hypothetical protein
LRVVVTSSNWTGMRDGIYQIEFESEQVPGKGIATVRNNRFDGIIEGKVYCVDYVRKGEKLSGQLQVLRYRAETHSVFVDQNGSYLTNATEDDGGFRISRASEGDAHVKITIRGARIADLD